MMGVTLRGIAGRKIRSLLTAFAVVLGIAMVSGTYVLTDTFQKAFDKIFTESYVGTDAVVSGKQLLEFSSSGRAPVPAELLDQIRALPEVDAAAGGIMDIQSNSNPAQLVDDDGKKIGGSGGAPTFGVGLDSSELRFSPLSLEEGTWARGPEQVVVDANTASKQGFEVGDSVGIAALVRKLDDLGYVDDRAVSITDVGYRDEQRVVVDSAFEVLVGDRPVVCGGNVNHAGAARFLRVPDLADRRELPVCQDDFGSSREAQAAGEGTDSGGE